jgi:hypothetical protein
VPSRKQRRRRQKERRHEYEYVYVDEEGHEVEVDEDDDQAAAPTRSPRSGDRRPAARSARAGRRVEPPSWNRVGKRALFLGPVMFILINLVAKDLSVAQRVYQTVILLALFLPFSYLMDSMLYRSYLKRTGAAPPPSRRRRSNGNAPES